jgi:SET domain-containing protein
VDASKIPCVCHPHIQSTKGRLINHSRKNPNLKLVPRAIHGHLYVLMITMEDIDSLTELCFDYDWKHVFQDFLLLKLILLRAFARNIRRKLKTRFQCLFLLDLTVSIFKDLDRFKNKMSGFFCFCFVF